MCKSSYWNLGIAFRYPSITPFLHPPLARMQHQFRTVTYGGRDQPSKDYARCLRGVETNKTKQWSVSPFTLTAFNNLKRIDPCQYLKRSK